LERASDSMRALYAMNSRSVGWMYSYLVGGREGHTTTQRRHGCRGITLFRVSMNKSGDDWREICEIPSRLGAVVNILLCAADGAGRRAATRRRSCVVVGLHRQHVAIGV
ncbi:hypothetical protein PFISCL1PPCAC_25781, partial [Pristionchus fissidentatus]